MKTVICELLHMDGTPDSDGEFTFADDIEFPEGYVSVRRNFDPSQPIGKARLFKEGNTLFANVELLDDVNGDYVPAIGGSYRFKRKTIRGTHCGYNIMFVGFCTKENVDKRIPIVKVL